MKSDIQISMEEYSKFVKNKRIFTDEQINGMINGLIDSFGFLYDHFTDFDEIGKRKYIRLFMNEICTEHKIQIIPI